MYIHAFINSYMYLYYMISLSLYLSFSLSLILSLSLAFSLFLSLSISTYIYIFFYIYMYIYMRRGSRASCCRCFSFFAVLMAKRRKIQKMSLSEKQELCDDYIRIRAERIARLVREMYAVRVFEEARLAEDTRMAGVLCATCGVAWTRAELVLECHIQGTVVMLCETRAIE